MRNYAAWIVGLVAIVYFQLVTYWQQATIETMLQTEQALVQDLAALSKDIQQVRRECGNDGRRLDKVERQMDIIVAASRAGWHQAHRMMRAGVFGR